MSDSLACLRLAACGLRSLGAPLLVQLRGLRELDLQRNTELGATPEALPAEVGG